MLSEKFMSVDIQDSYINLLIGNGKKVVFSKRVELREGMVSNFDIQNVDYIVNVIRKCKEESNIKVKNIIFSMSGQDVVIRHTEVPIMEKKKVLDSAKWEMNQYLPNEGMDYYVDYEIVEKIDNKDTKVYKILICAAPKDRVKKFTEIAKKLDMNISSIGISANYITKVFRQAYYNDNNKKSIAVVELGSSSSSIVILNKGKLFINKDISFGKENIINKLMVNYGMDKDLARDYLTNKIDLTHIKEEDQIQTRVKRLIDNVLSSFDKVIKFYNMEKSNEKLQEIYVVGDCTRINGLKAYLEEFFGNKVNGVKSLKDLKLPVRTDDNFEFNYYMNVLGSVIKPGKNEEINLLPATSKSKSTSEIDVKKQLIIGGTALGILALGIIIPKIYTIKVNNDIDDLKHEISKNISIETENRKLNSTLSNYKSTISKYKSIVVKEDDKVSKYVSGIESYIPKDVKLTSINKSKEGYVLKGEASNGNGPAVFVANLQTSKEYSNSRLLTVNYGTGSYKFTINLGGVSNE